MCHNHNKSWGAFPSSQFPSALCVILEQRAPSFLESKIGKGLTLPGSRGATLLFCRSSRSPSFHSSSPLHELVHATKIVNSIIKEIRKRATIWHQISGGVERAAVRSRKTIKKWRLFVELSTERPLGSGKRITITDTWEHTDGMNEIRTVNIIWS